MLFIIILLSFVLHLLVEEWEGNEIDVIEDLKVVGNFIYNWGVEWVDSHPDTQEVLSY